MNRSAFPARENGERLGAWPGPVASQHRENRHTVLVGQRRDRLVQSVGVGWPGHGGGSSPGVLPLSAQPTGVAAGEVLFDANLTRLGMASTGELAFLGVFVALGVAITGAGMLRLRTWWTMRALDPTGALSVESGLQEFEGRATPVEETVTAPFSGTESLICDHKVEAYDQDDEGSNWEPVEGGEQSVPFEIEQDGRAVAVGPEGANYLLSDEFSVDTAREDDLPEGVQAYVGEEVDGGSKPRHTLEIGGLEIDGRRYRFTEQRLDAGEDVYVVGPAERDGTAVGGSDARLSVAAGDRGWFERLLGDPFVVADAGEDVAERRQLKGALLVLVLGLVVLGVSLFILFA